MILFSSVPNSGHGPGDGKQFKMAYGISEEEEESLYGYNFCPVIIASFAFTLHSKILTTIMGQATLGCLI